MEQWHATDPLAEEEVDADVLLPSAQKNKITDPGATELADIHAAREHAVTVARELKSNTSDFMGEDWSTWSMVVHAAPQPQCGAADGFSRLRSIAACLRHSHISASPYHGVGQFETKEAGN